MTVLAAIEPLATSLLLGLLGLLLATSALLSRPLTRAGVPVVLLFLVLGMLAGSEGPGNIPFDDHHLAFRLGTLALVLILIDGGLNTPLANIRRAVLPASLLATVGVAATAGAVAVAARALGLPWAEAALLGAVVSSTDAAAVFSVLRGSGQNLKPRTGRILELESGLNDPMAVILTITLSQAMIGAASPSGLGLSWSLVWLVPLQLLIGGAVGAGVGYFGRWMLGRVQLSTAGLYPALTLALAFVAFGLATVLNGSGFLAVYLSALILGAGPLPYRAGLSRIHDAVAWLSQIIMFLMLGLLVFPSRLIDIAGTGLVLALFLALLARPAAVVLCLLPFRMQWTEILFISWVGLRGAVPIVLASYPVLVGVPGADRIFDIVFFIVVVNAIIPGAAIRLFARLTRQEEPKPPVPQAAIEVNSRAPVQGDLSIFYIDRSLAVCGAKFSQIRFPERSAAVLLVRNDVLMACRGETRLEPGDFVYVFCQPADRPFIELLFGRPHETPV